MIKVGKLIAALQTLPEDLEVKIVIPSGVFTGLVYSISIIQKFDKIEPAFVTLWVGPEYSTLKVSLV